MRVAVVRDMWKEPDTILAPDERVSVEAAIRAVTRDAAWACHSEGEIGSLEPGKLADLVVLEEDPRSVEPRKISDIRVSQTWLDGRQVYGG
jgi:predicted amidohydrolase YtcJ